MNHRGYTAITATIAGMVLMSACTGHQSTSDTSSAPPPSSTTDAGVPNSGAPKVDTPLPAKVLDGSPCDNALTQEQLKSFLGETKAPTPGDESLGKSCDWRSASGTGAGFLIGYQTSSDQGISLAYKNVKPTAARWVDLDPVQSYPAIAFVEQGVDPTDKRHCGVVVGVSDELAYTVSLTIGERAASQGKDACIVGRDIADAVMTNLKQRA